MAENKKGKYFCADFLAVIGAILLLGLEYFKTLGFMEMPVTWEKSFFPVMGRWFCLSGAMLMAACMGYVLSSKRFSGKMIHQIIRLLYIYFISSLLAMLAGRIILQEVFTAEDVFNALIDFTATDTARIAGMYLLLLLFAPFLSAAFHDLHNFQARLMLLVITAGIST